MNEHDESAVWGISLGAVLITLIISVTLYNMNEMTLKSQVVPQMVIEGETP